MEREKEKRAFSHSKMKVLRPSLREHVRYIGFEVISEGEEISFNEFRSAFTKKLLEFAGILGYSKAGMLLIKDKYETEKSHSKGILRINNKYVDIAKAVFLLLKKINKKKVLVKSVRVSGMINKVFILDKTNKKITDKKVKS